MDNQTSNTPDNASIEESLNLRLYWHIVMERRWIIVAVFISVMVLCSIYLVRAPRIYKATARIQIDREAETIASVRDPMAFESRETDYLQTQYKNLQSRTLVDEMTNNFKLPKMPLITVTPLRMTRLVDVSIEHQDPVLATNMVTYLCSRFIEQNLDRRRASFRMALSNINTEIYSSKTNLDAAEKDLSEFREIKAKTVSVEESQNMIMASFKQATEQHATAESKAAAAERTYQEVQKLLQGGSNVESIPAVSSDKLIQDLKNKLATEESELASLLKKYKEGWPAVIQKHQAITQLKASIQENAQKIIKSIEAEATIARSQEVQLGKIKSEKEAEQMNLGKLRVQYDEKKRQLDLIRELYMGLRKSKQEQELSMQTKSNNMFVRDEVTLPTKFVRPRILLTLALGVVMGIAAGFGLAFFVHYLDDSIKTQEDVENYLKLTFLGYVPNIKSSSVIERDLQAHLHPQSAAAEGFRTLRAAVSLMPNSDQYRLISVTSTIPSEGKSLVTSNLAIVTAQAGFKTLLVDADLRRPTVHKTFQLHSPVGLSAYLGEAAAKMEEITHVTDIKNLDVICAGAIPPNPSELAGSKRMKDFLKEALQRYDRVFLDCPPVSAVADPLVIAALSDGVIFVSKFNKIRREHARRTIQRVQDSGIHIIGAVLNDIDFEGKDSYYYSYYYYQNRYYTSHYKTTPDKATPDKGGTDKTKSEPVEKS